MLILKFCCGYIKLNNGDIIPTNINNSVPTLYQNNEILPGGCHCAKYSKNLLE